MKKMAKKQKRYFCDSLNMFFEMHGGFVKWIVFILCIISCITTYKVISTKYAYQLEAYSEEDLIYLSEVANNIWDKENKTLSLYKIPKDVNASFNETYNGKLSITLTRDKEYLFAKWPTVYIEVSEDFKSLTQTPLSKENFVKATKLSMLILSVGIGFFLVCVMFLLIFIILFVMFIVSIINKNIAKKKIA